MAEVQNKLSGIYSIVLIWHRSCAEGKIFCTAVNRYQQRFTPLPHAVRRAVVASMGE
jgi:hypothetical protein